MKCDDLHDTVNIVRQGAKRTKGAQKGAENCIGRFIRWVGLVMKGFPLGV